MASEFSEGSQTAGNSPNVPQDPAFAAARLCLCGRVIPAARSGRPRLTCSAPCKLRRDQLLKAIDRRRGWIALWQLNRAGYDRAEVGAAVVDLEADIEDLLSALRGLPVNPLRQRREA